MEGKIPVSEITTIIRFQLNPYDPDQNGGHLIEKKKKSRDFDTAPWDFEIC